jgi:FlaA1/EpsC-like NDP-sugar epimerase
MKLKMKEKELQKSWLKKVLNKRRTPLEESLLAFLAGVIVVAFTIILDVICYKNNWKFFRVSYFYEVLMYPLIIISFFLLLLVILLYKSANLNPKFLIFIQKSIVFIGVVLFLFGFFQK